MSRCGLNSMTSAATTSPWRLWNMLRTSRKERPQAQFVTLREQMQDQGNLHLSRCTRPSHLPLISVKHKFLKSYSQYCYKYMQKYKHKDTRDRDGGREKRDQHFRKMTISWKGSHFILFNAKSFSLFTPCFVDWSNTNLKIQQPNSAGWLKCWLTTKTGHST